ncbi:MAG: FMN-binding protein, partial [Defluviitaleaceae bacterium]|nr:FMN-binding protein [Defluviitaleaceae bacterium]
MKKFGIILLLVSILVFSACAGNLNDSVWEPRAEAAVAGNDLPSQGTHQGMNPDGYLGAIYLEVRVDAVGRIVGIEITQHQDTPAFAYPAFDYVIGQILATQSTGVDSMSGST